MEAHCAARYTRSSCGAPVLVLSRHSPVWDGAEHPSPRSGNTLYAPILRLYISRWHEGRKRQASNSYRNRLVGSSTLDCVFKLGAVLPRPGNIADCIHCDCARLDKANGQTDVTAWQSSNSNRLCTRIDTRREPCGKQ